MIYDTARAVTLYSPPPRWNCLPLGIKSGSGQFFKHGDPSLVSEVLQDSTDWFYKDSSRRLLFLCFHKKVHCMWHIAQCSTFVYWTVPTNATSTLWGLQNSIRQASLPVFHACFSIPIVTICESDSHCVPNVYPCSTSIRHCKLSQQGTKQTLWHCNYLHSVESLTQKSTCILVFSPLFCPDCIQQFISGQCVNTCDSA